ncbi:hemagglutinin repeat-containing protein (plasmid) [Rhizobium sp. NXC24]|nr:hemagglutinin repeat-containing protein [Rhizobium sp. NXC24]
MDMVTIVSPETLTLAGGVLSGNTVNASAANGINIESRQDIASYDEKTKSAQLGISSGGYNQGTITGDYANVSQQSGIFTGSGGYHVSTHHRDSRRFHRLQCRSLEQRSDSQSDPLIQQRQFDVGLLNELRLQPDRCRHSRPRSSASRRRGFKVNSPFIPVDWLPMQPLLRYDVGYRFLA